MAAATQTSHDRLDATAVFILVALCAVWALGQTAIKIANTGISPLLQAGLRSIGSAILLALWCRWRGKPLLLRDGTLILGIVAGILFTLEFVFIYQGLQFTSASRSALFVNTSPFVVAIGAHWLVPGERITRVKLLGLALAFAGVAIAFQDSLALPTRHEIIGDLLCLAGAVAWGATTVVVKATGLARIGAERALLYQLVVSAIVLPLLSLQLREPGIFNPAPKVLAALGFQIVVIAFVSYTIWYWLIAHYPASRVTPFGFLTPIFGIAFGAWLLQEHVSTALLVALAMIASGIYLVNRPQSRAAPVPTQSI